MWFSKGFDDWNLYSRVKHDRKTSRIWWQSFPSWMMSTVTGNAPSALPCHTVHVKKRMRSLWMSHGCIRCSKFFFKSHCTDVGWTVANKLWHCSPWVCLEIGHTPQCLRCVHHFQAHFIPGWSSHKTSHSVSNSIFGPIWVNFITTSVE